MEQILFDCSTGEEIAVSVDFATHALTLGGESETHPTFEALERAYVSKVGALIAENSELVGLDDAPARLVDLASARGYEAKPGVPPHPAVVAARSALHDAWGDDEDFEGLAESLEYVIAIAPGGEVGPGRSKRGGEPDLPSGFEWPGRRSFLCQLALDEVSRFDVAGNFPERGMIYYFTSEDCTDNRAVYVDVPPSALARTPAPPEARPPSVWASDFVEQAIRFEPAVTLAQWAIEAEESLPSTVLDALRAGLGHDVALRSPRARLLGVPAGEVGWGVFAEIEPPKDVFDRASFSRYLGPLTLALQLPFADGFVFLGVPAPDLPTGDFTNARATYWGT